MRSFLQRNAWLKLLSLVVAYLTWALVVDRPALIRQMTVPFNIGEVPENVLVIDYTPERVRIQMEGDDAAFSQVDNVHAVLDVTGLGPGQHVLPIRPENIRDVPYGVELDVLTGQVTVTIEALHSKLVQVTPKAEGAPAEGFEVAGMRVVPAAVDVTGPRPVVETLQPFEARIDVTGKRAPFETSYLLQPPSGDLQIETPSVQVSISIQEIKVSEQIVLDVSATVDGWLLEPTEVTATVEAPPSRLPALRRLAIATVTPRVDSAEGQDVPVDVQFPGLEPAARDLVRVVEIEPPIVVATPEPGD